MRHGDHTPTIRQLDEKDVVRVELGLAGDAVRTFSVKDLEPADAAEVVSRVAAHLPVAREQR